MKLKLNPDLWEGERGLSVVSDAIGGPDKVSDERGRVARFLRSLVLHNTTTATVHVLYAHTQ